MGKSELVSAITEPIKTIRCSQCSATLDIGGLEAFVAFSCPGCGTEKNVPVRFANLILMEELGSGGMGAVYRGIDPELDRTVAVKVLLEKVMGDPAKIESFRKEAQAAARLNHPNVASVYSFGVQNGQPYIVMEFLKGQSLFDMTAERQGLREAEALKVALDAASGLSAAWEEGLVHADIKPENILFDKSGRAKLIDFGLAMFAGSDSGDSGGIWGTPYYTSPERLLREKLDLRSDIYSLGATLYYALTGRPPHDGDDVRTICRAKLDVAVEPPSKYRRGLLPATDEIVCRMLRRNPKERYPTYSSLISDLRKALQAASARPASAVAPPVPRESGAGAGTDAIGLSQPAAAGRAGASQVSQRQAATGRGRALAVVMAGGVGVVLCLSLLYAWRSTPEVPAQPPPPVKLPPEVFVKEPTAGPRATPALPRAGDPGSSSPEAMPKRPGTARVYTEAELALNARNDSYSVSAGVTIVLAVLQNDEWVGDNFASLASVGTPSNGTATVQNNAVRYVAKAGFTGTDSFTYTVRYPSGRISTATVAVVVGVEDTAGGVVLNSTSQTALTNVASAVTTGGAGGDTTDDRLGTVMVCGENGPFETRDKAFDNASDTKWLHVGAIETWIEYAYASGISGRLTAYAITSANDMPERDPATWQLLGSNDGGTTWAVVDSRSNVAFGERFQKQTFAVSGAPAYKAYRLNIQKVANPAVGGCQLAEIELLGEQVSGDVKRSPVAQHVAVAPVVNTVTTAVPVVAGGVAGIVAASGGIVTNYTMNGTNFTAHIFTTSGVLTVTRGGSVDVLVVGGGGGGGCIGGGGGGGGVIQKSGVALAVQSYTVTVGNGGIGSSSDGSDGGVSSFNNLAAGGGGGGGKCDNPGRAGVNATTVGGSGGGGGRGTAQGAASAGSPAGNGSVTFSHAGGACPYTGWESGSGGGGAGAVGYNGGDDSAEHTGTAAEGGVGVQSSISGSAVYYGGGGGGAWQVGGDNPDGGLGGGGKGYSGSDGTAGIANTGGGGGGGWGPGGYNGGSGIVIVRYVTRGGRAPAVLPAPAGL